MADEKKTRPYRVLMPEPPTSTQFGEGDERMRYVLIGVFEAHDPDAAIEAAAEIAADSKPSWVHGLLVAIPDSKWSERMVEAKTMRIWRVAKVGSEPIDDEIET